tara:strand:+ start:4340 stop:4651 length:312 start_codon:yes stop_codon:yes gene_type:complete
MKAFLKVLIFFLVNAVGFSVGPLIIAFSIFKLQLIDLKNEANVGVVDYVLNGPLMMTISLTWFVCFLFSFASFFLSGIWKKIFLLCPIFVPMVVTIYKISLLV